MPTDLCLSDLIGPRGRADLIQAIVCTYKADVNWIASHFDPTTNLTFVLPHRDQKPPAGLPHEYHPTTTTIYPRTDQAYNGTMHVKLLVLVYDAYCRIVVMTANLYRFDWTECDNVSGC